MIILEEVADRIKDDKFNGLTLRHIEPAFQPDYTRSTPSVILPDYATSEAQHRRDVTIPSSKFKLDAKSWRAALIALCVYTFLTLTIAVPIIVLKSKDNKQPNQYHQPPPASPVWPADFAIPPPSKMAFGAPPLNETMSCNNWQTNLNSPNSVTTSFQLLPSDCITIRSNASYNSMTLDQLNGTLSVSMNDDSSMWFTVTIRSSSKDIRDRTSVCSIEKGPHKGLSIFIPSGIRGDDNLTIDISASFPRNSNIDTFTTFLPMFSQKFGDLREHSSFRQLSLYGSHRLINCVYLQASQIIITNVLSSVQGSFNVTRSLSIDSIRGPIDANVTLSQWDDQVQPTTLILGTGNSTLNANITLNALTTSISSSYPNFAAQISNFDGPIRVGVAYGNTSLNSPFQMNVQNNVASSTISMDGTFEGCFNAEAKLSRVSVHQTQKNTSRTLDYDTLLPDLAMGKVSKDPKRNLDACDSFVNILSALGPVDLTFGP